MKTVPDKTCSTDANVDSPLFRLPPEIRNMIFEIAIYKPPKMTLHFNWFSRYSSSGYSSYIHKKSYASVGFNLRLVCRQAYAETATLMYRLNKFSFTKRKALKKWLSKRLPAELEAIEHLELLEGDAPERTRLFQELKSSLCPNIRTLTKNEKTAESVKLRSLWNDDLDNVSTDDEEGQEELKYHKNDW
jgi:hypothetical protein